MARHPFFPLAVPGQSGALLLTPCPGTLDVSLDQALDQLQAAGATAVISLMTLPEMSHHQVDPLPERCAARALQWIHLPVEDEGAPTAEFSELWREARADIHARLDRGESIAIHCRGGSGRTGIVAAQILIERGSSVEAAVQQVKQLRPNAFTHAVQVNYIEGLRQAH